MQPAVAAPAPGQRHVERVGAELRCQLRLGQRLAPCGERVLAPRFRRVDGAAGCRALRRRQLAEAFQPCRQRAGLPQVFRLGVLESRGVGARGEIGEGVIDDSVEVIHWGQSCNNRRCAYCCPVKITAANYCSSDPKQKKGEAGFASPSFARIGQAREAFACSAILPNAALSWTASSASTLRSISIDAFFSPFMNALYDRPSSRAAALIRAIHRARNSRFFCRRSRY